jgi:hypothetical protein
MPHTNSVCRTQKKGRWSSSRSRRVPPPKAATKDTTHTPTTSNRLRAAAMMPESAKAAVAAISSSRRRVWSQSEVGMERGVSEGVIVAHGMWAAPGLANLTVS